jgi:hypothetical protein
LDELRWFVPVNTIKAVTVSEEHLNLALDHYYSLELEAELGPLVRAVLVVLQPDVVQVRLTTIEGRTSVDVTRHGSPDALGAPAPYEVSPNAVARLKELAGIGPESVVPQHGSIPIEGGGRRVIIEVEARLETDADTLILTIPERHPIGDGG